MQIMVVLSVFVIIWVSSVFRNWHQFLLYPLWRLLATITPGKCLRKSLQAPLPTLNCQPARFARVPPFMLVAWPLVSFTLLGPCGFQWTISLDLHHDSTRMLSFRSLGCLLRLGPFHCVQSAYSSSQNLHWGLGHWTPLSWCGIPTFKPQTGVPLYKAITLGRGYLMSVGGELTG